MSSSFGGQTLKEAGFRLIVITRPTNGRPALLPLLSLISPLPRAMSSRRSPKKSPVENPDTGVNPGPAHEALLPWDNPKTRPVITKIVSGGQTGADRAALDAAIECGVPHGGWCPRGRRAEDGRLSHRYRLVETESDHYLVRTEQNVIDSDGTLVLTLGRPGGGSARTLDFARRHRRPHLHLELGGMSDDAALAEIRSFLELTGIAVLNVAGSRESSEPGIYARVRGMMDKLLNMQ